MNHTDTLKILAVLRAAYPGFYAKMTKNELNGVVNLWEDMFSGDDYAIVSAAVKAMFASRADDWPPPIGAVKEHVRRLTSPPERSDAEAWDMAAKAVRRTDWNHPEVQFNRLPPDVRDAVGSPHTLVEWGKVSEEVLGSVISALFRKTFRARQQAAREYAVLPPDVKAIMQTTAGRLALDENED